jgi:hypothetical protein
MKRLSRKRRNRKMKYPYIKLVLPTELKNVKNGQVPADRLRKTLIGGRLWHWASISFDLMVGAAKKEGIEFRNIGDFRPYDAQLAMFRDRYDVVDKGRKPQVTRNFEGKTWYLKPGKSPSGTPGTSNHGMGLAIDLSMKDGSTLGGNAKAMAWMCANAPTYGFYLQGSDPKSPEFEAWHWQYAVGDNIPKPVHDLFAYLAAVAEEEKKKKG